MSSFAERRALLAQTFQTLGSPSNAGGGGGPALFIPGMPMPGSMPMGDDDDDADPMQCRRPPPRPVAPTYEFPEAPGAPPPFKKSKKEYPSNATTGTEGCNDFHSFIMENNPERGG